jgi:hypothetical protein
MILWFFTNITDGHKQAMGNFILGMSIVSVAVMACATGQARERIIAESDGSFVRIDKASTGKEGAYAHPAQIAQDRLRALLGSVTVESPSGTLLGRKETLPLFDPEDLDFLAPALSEALRQARADERAVFYLRQRGRLLRREITTGALAVSGDALLFTLGHFRRTDVEEPQPDRNVDTERRVRADPMFQVFDRGVRLSATSGVPGDQNRTLLFARAAETLAAKPRPLVEPAPSATESAALETSPHKVPPSSMPQLSRSEPSEVVQGLQRQIKELTDANQELRGRLKELNTELAEIKQTLADKVMELDRIKRKSKGKTPAPSTR